MEDKIFDFVFDVKVKVIVQFGFCQLLMCEVFEFVFGVVIQFSQYVSDFVGFYVNDKFIVYGEVVVVEDSFGIKIIEFVGLKV